MRVFVGIPIAEKVQKEISRFSAKFLMPNSELLINSKILNDEIRIIKPKNLHITLVPPWNMNHEAGSVDQEEVIRQLQEVADRTNKFEIKFNKVEFGPSRPPSQVAQTGRGRAKAGPNKKSPRLIWATSTGSGPSASDETTKEIQDLRLKIYDALGQKIDNRKFRPHCTIARFRKHPHPGPLPSSEREISRVNWQMKVKSFVLYESKLLPEGAEYRVIERFKD